MPYFEAKEVSEGPLVRRTASLEERLGGRDTCALPAPATGLAPSPPRWNKARIGAAVQAESRDADRMRVSIEAAAEVKQAAGSEPNRIAGDLTPHIQPEVVAISARERKRTHRKGVEGGC